eukprot:Awhi_evm1s7741
MRRIFSLFLFSFLILSILYSFVCHFCLRRGLYHLSFTYSIQLPDCTARDDCQIDPDLTSCTIIDGDALELKCNVCDDANKYVDDDGICQNCTHAIDCAESDNTTCASVEAFRTQLRCINCSDPTNYPDANGVCVPCEKVHEDCDVPSDNCVDVLEGAEADERQCITCIEAYQQPNGNGICT